MGILEFEIIFVRQLESQLLKEGITSGQKHSEMTDAGKDISRIAKKVRNATLNVMDSGSPGPHFLANGGLVAQLLRDKDWTASGLGSPQTWPQVLKSALGICLPSRQPMGIWWGTDFRHFYNDAYQPMLGSRDHPDLLGAPGREAWPEIWGIVGPALHHVMETGQATCSEDIPLTIRRNGHSEEAHFTFSYSPLRDDGGRIVGVFCTCLETTARALTDCQEKLLQVQAEREREDLRVSRQQLELDQQRLTSSLELVSEQARVAELGAEMSVALTRSNTLHDMLTMCCQAIVDKLDAALARIWTLDEDGDVLELQASAGVYTHVDGPQSRVPVGKFNIGEIAQKRSPHLTNHVVDDPHGGDSDWAKPEGLAAFAGYPLVVDERLVGVIALYARRYLNDSVLRALSAISSTVAIGIRRKRSEADLIAAKEAAEAASEAKSQFLASMSHELRTPLNAIIGYSEMLQEEAEETGAQAFRGDLEKIRTAGRHLLSLISDVLDLSKIEAGKMELHNETYDVAAMLGDVVATVAPLMLKNENRLELKSGPSLGLMYNDLTKVRQSLFNLLSNASKFTRNGAVELNVHVQQDAGRDWMIFEVSDTGIGIAPDRIAELFRPFSQLDNSLSRHFGGTGLGLAITQHFCQMMGGSINVSSESGKGSRFTIRLPRIIEDKSPVSTRLIGKPPSSGPTVLVIDDDAVSRDLMRRHLNREGFHSVMATSGEEGLRLARQIKPDFITLDVLMPGLDGWAVLHDLKCDPELNDIPVIMATMVGERGLGYALGAADYLIKPITREKLSEVLVKYRHEAPPPCTVLLVDDDESSRLLLNAAMQKEGWNVVMASNGLEALAIVDRQRPSLILLDLLMPQMDGFEFAVQLRKRQDWLDIPVVVLTAKDLTAEDELRLRGNVERLVSKGVFDPNEVLGEVRRLLFAMPRRRLPSHN